MLYLHHKLGPVARRLTAITGSRLVWLGDSTAAPANSPRWTRGILRQWDTPIAALAWYSPQGLAPDEGLNAFNVQPSFATGATLDGVVVPPGFSCCAAVFAADANGTALYRPTFTSLQSYADGHPFLGGVVRVSLAVLGTANPVTKSFFSYRTAASATLDNRGLQTHAITAGSGAWQRLDFPPTTVAIPDEDTLGAYWTTAFGEENTAGKTFAYGGLRVEAVGVAGLEYAAIAVGGYTIWDHLPQSLGGTTLNAASAFSDAERLAKFNTFGWPDVVAVQLGINMEADEAAAVRTTWGDRLRQLLDWHVTLAAGAGRQPPLFLLVVPWATDASESRRVDLEDELREVADERDDCGVLNLYRLIKGTHGSYSVWQASLLSDGVHQSEAGADEFARLAWEALVEAAAEGLPGSGESAGPTVLPTGAGFAAQATVAGAEAGRVVAA